MLGHKTHRMADILLDRLIKLRNLIKVNIKSFLCDLCKRSKVKVSVLNDTHIYMLSPEKEIRSLLPL